MAIKSKSVLLLLMLVATQMARAQTGTPDNEKQAVLASQAARISAMIAADIQQLDALLDEDLSYSHTTGWSETKPSFLKTVQSGRIDYQQFEPREVAVRLYDDTAVLTGLVDVNLGRTDFTIRFLEVQRKIGDTWKLTAWQSVINKVE